jgi:multiple sugar transport system permease protein
MDGSTFIDKLIHVVFPMLKPLIIINFVGAFIGSWYAAAGNILVMTGGGAGTEVVDLHIWFKAFTFLKFGPATAMAWMLGFMLIGFTVYQLRMLSRIEFRATGAKG